MIWRRLTVCSLALAGIAAGQDAATGWHEGFEAGWQDRWNEQRLAARSTEFMASVRDGADVLRVESRGSAGALIRRVELAPQDPRVSWRWFLDRAIPASPGTDSNERSRAGDDYAARVFVIFGTDLGNDETRALCYVWARDLPIGTTFPSPVADRIQMLVVRSGTEELGAWQTESVDPVADYRRVFGNTAPAIGAIGVMSDTDDTSSQSAMLFDDIRVSGVDRQ
ncbi:MAG: DUF3047 domain-containing protein [Acidobacteria bacterium]|nr:DUF3047 domain-containing protein [Acidobacteriota bacterium]